MYLPNLPTLLFAALAVLAFLLPNTAGAACSRPINIPFSSAGLSAIIDGDTISGIYPELLREMAGKENCTVIFSAVPRARLEQMFKDGRADLLIPAKKTAKRDTHGIFVPLIDNRMAIISIESGQPAIKNARDLLIQNKLRVALVRGFDYGPAYLKLVSELSRQKRVFFEVDPTSVARMLKAGAADLTIMVPYVFAGALQDDARVESLIGMLRYEIIPELPWSDSGVYLSNRLSADDSLHLRRFLDNAARSGIVWKKFQHSYSEELLKDSTRPFTASR